LYCTRDEIYDEQRKDIDLQRRITIIAKLPDWEIQD